MRFHRNRYKNVMNGVQHTYEFLVYKIHFFLYAYVDLRTSNVIHCNTSIHNLLTQTPTSFLFMKNFELLVERLLFASRWILAPIYLGMSLLLIALGFLFFREVFHILGNIETLTETSFILAALGLIDLLLVGGLMIMVMFSSYENFVSKISVNDSNEKLGWLGQLDTGTLKLKIAASIVAISSIFLLKKYVSATEIMAKLPPDAPFHANPLFWYTIMHLMFVVSALLLGVLDRMSFASHRNHNNS